MNREANANPAHTLLENNEGLPRQVKAVYFAMRCNGFYPENVWQHDPSSITHLSVEFKGQQVAFFGPSSQDAFFSSKFRTNAYSFITSFQQIAVCDIIEKIRDTDSNQAERIAFLLGGIVRHQIAYLTLEEITREVDYVARMTKLGERKSYDAIASAMAMYVISGGSIEDDPYFAGHVYHMAEAIYEDPIIPRETKNLGLSQVARLRAFRDKLQGANAHPFPKYVSTYETGFEKFPTVGAEFHFPTSILEDQPNFLKRLAILNMSQHQRGSYVQFSRNDRDVIEVRMNPSTFPITIANWSHMRMLLPELNRAFFTITLNRKGDFAWTNGDDVKVLSKLRGLGLLTYASFFQNSPHQEKKEEVDFGNVYLGQTVKLHSGEYQFSGNWGGGQGVEGQFGIYAGYGDIFPRLAYYLSMGLRNPHILDSERKLLDNIQSLGTALSVGENRGGQLFRTIRNQIENNRELRNARDAGNQIIELLQP